MGNGNSPNPMNPPNSPANPPNNGEAGAPKDSRIGAEGWRAIAAFAIVLMTFGVLFWLIYQAAILGHVRAYCDAKPFLAPFFILAFSILGLFLGGWAEANWEVPAGLPLPGLVLKAGGAVAFFLIAVVVTMLMNSSVVCTPTLTYNFSFKKPSDVAIEPDLEDFEYEEWYQNYAHNSPEAKGVLLYPAGQLPAAQNPDELRFKLAVGTDDLVCPINIRVHYSYESFDADCDHRMVDADSISFRLSEDAINFASKLARQPTTRAPIEAAIGGEAVAENAPPAPPADKNCFAEIWAGKRIPPPYNETFNTKSNLQQGDHVVLHLYRGSVCLEDGKHEIIYPKKTSSLSLPSSLVGFLNFVIPAAHAQDTETCPANPQFDEALQKLASPDADKALVTLISDFPIHECKIFDTLLDPKASPKVIVPLLKVLIHDPVNWSNNRLIANDEFPNFQPTGKAKRVFDRIITNFIISDDEDVRYQARKVLTTYPAKYMRDKYGSISIADLDKLQQRPFAYAGVFMYFRAIISGEHFTAGQMTADIMSKVIAEYEKGKALRDYLKRDVVDSYILDYGLGSAVRNYEKSEKGSMVPAEYKPSQQRFRAFLDNIVASEDAYPFNNQLGWATCFAYTSPITNLTSPSGQLALTLDDAEWYNGEIIPITDDKFALNQTGRTVLKACPGQGYPDTEASVATGTMVKRLLHKAENERINWLFVQTDKGFGWLQEQPKPAVIPTSPGQALN